MLPILLRTTQSFCPVQVEINFSPHGDNIRQSQSQWGLFFPALKTLICPVSSWQFIKSKKGVRLPGVSHYADREPSNKKEKINRTLFACGDKAQQRTRAESTVAPPLSIHKEGHVFTHC